MASGMLGLRRVHAVEWAATWAVVAAGAAGLRYTTVALPWRCHRRRRRLAQPATVAARGLLLSGLVAARMPWQQLAEASAANVVVSAWSLLLPAAAVWLGVLAVQQRQVGAAWRLEVAAAWAVLALSAMLATFGLLPIAPWRW